MVRSRLFLIVIIAAWCWLPAGASAQAVNYMDEAGNIKFADSVAEVPDKYRDQVIKKKPNRMSKREYARYMTQLRRDQRTFEAKKARAEKERLREAKRKARQAEIERMRDEKAKKSAEKAEKKRS